MLTGMTVTQGSLVVCTGGWGLKVRESRGRLKDYVMYWIRGEEQGEVRRGPLASGLSKRVDAGCLLTQGTLEV